MSDPWDRPKFQHGVGALRNVALFLLTAVTTFLAVGPWYSLGLLTILAAHEFGHYFACRWHDVDATLPYFIPGPPFMLTGTFGAVIRIREPFPSKRALFDIGVAGPIAGFITLLPFLIVGVYLSRVMPIPEDIDPLYFGEPLLFKAIARLVIGPLPEGTDIFLHPMGFAAWFGMLATALNLLPFGQLDGGHIAYAVFGRRAVYLSGATLAAVIALSVHAPSWIAMAVMLAAMSWFIGLRHPLIGDEDTALGRGRQILAVVALLILVLCFTPTPISW